MTSGVVRRGSTVRRPLGPWTPAVHSLLRHLEEVGFPGGPRVVGIDGDVEVLTFIDGEVAVDPTWEPGRGQRLAGPVRTEKSLETMARLLADYHVAVRGFDPPEPLFRFHPHARRPTELICHALRYLVGEDIIFGRLPKLHPPAMVWSTRRTFG